jgi:mRNA interferase HigB
MDGMVHVISRRALSEFWTTHPEARGPLAAWFRVLEGNEFDDFHSIRRAFRSADYVAPFTVFDVGGNRYRVVTVIHYNRQRVYIRRVLTHAEYDRWSARDTR